MYYMMQVILTVKTTEMHPVPVHTTWFHVAIDFIGPISPISLSGNRCANKCTNIILCMF